MRVPDISRQFNTFILDWLSFTVPVADSQEQTVMIDYWCNLLGDSQPREAAHYGYTHCMSVAGSGLLMWHPQRLEMGIHIQLGSKALSKLSYAPVDLLNIIQLEDGKISRLDLAIDSDLLTMDDVWYAIKSGELVTKIRNGRRVTGFDVENPDNEDGSTIYLGSPTSRRRIRIYDKAAEQKESGIWTRIEVQFRKEHAVTAGAHLRDHGNPADLLVSSIDFRQLNSSNTTRRSQSEWWVELLGSTGERVSFAIAQVEKTIERIRGWIERQVSPSLATLDIAFDDKNLLWLYDIVTQGQKKISDSQISLAYRYKEQTCTLQASI